MAEKLLRGGQAVYAADGTYLGRLLQRDARFTVVAKSWWRLDFYVIPSEEVAAAVGGTLVLRCLAGDVRPETADPWSPAPDPVGNANGADLEPLRAGMAELDRPHLGASSAPRVGAMMTSSRPEPPLPTPEHIDTLDRARIERIDAQIDRYIAAELEDLQIAASCEAPPGFVHAASYQEAFALGAARLAARPAIRPAAVVSAPSPRVGTPPDQGPVAPAARLLSAVGDEAARGATDLERILRRAGFSRAEAGAIAAGGYEVLAALRAGSSPAAGAEHGAAGEGAAPGAPRWQG